LRHVWDHPDAAAERDAAAEWYEERVPGLGLAFYSAIDGCVESLARDPALYPKKPNGVRKCLLPLVFPYSIYHLERKDDIVILAYAHQRRRPGYWRTRLKTI